MCMYVGATHLPTIIHNGKHLIFSVVHLTYNLNKVLLSKMQKHSLSLSARQRVGGYRRAFLFPDDRQMALFLRGVDREDGAWGSGTARSGASPKIWWKRTFVHHIERVCLCVMYACGCICKRTLWWFSMMISTTMFWNLMFIMAATVSSWDLISVGPKIIPRLDTVIRFCSLWEETLCK